LAVTSLWMRRDGAMRNTISDFPQMNYFAPRP
jgi:hypothetical protein